MIVAMDLIEVSLITTGLKQLARKQLGRELGVPVLAAAQRRNKRSMLSDLRDGRDLKMDVD